MNLVKHSNKQINIAYILCFFFILASGCSKNEKSDKYVIRVNHAVLTEEQIRSALAEKRNSGKLRAEFINDWIEKEILFQEAVKNGIVDEKEFNSILEQSKKKLAVSMFIDKYLDKENSEPSEDELKQYYENNKDDFKLNDEMFRLNIVFFDSFDKAVQFRNTSIETNWNNGINMFQNSTATVEVSRDQLISRYQIYPQTFLRSISALQKDEISLVIETEPAKFAVVQLLEKFGKDIIPPYEVVKDEVNTRVTLIKNKEKVKQYLDKLIADHNLEIKRYSE
jgi:hypothetical protein